MKQHSYVLARAMLLLGGLVVALSVLTGASFSAAAMRCHGAPFSFTSIRSAAFTHQGSHANIAWGARGQTALSCPNGAILTVDVWEHAFVGLRGAAGTPGRVRLSAAFRNRRPSAPVAERRRQPKPWLRAEPGGTVPPSLPGGGGVVSGRPRADRMLSPRKDFWPGRLMGPAELSVSVPDGGTILLGGIISGEGSCTGTICVVDAEVHANSRDGAKLRILQRVTIDLANRVITAIDVRHIVIEFTGAG